MLAVHPVSVSPARRAALSALARVRRDRAFSGAVLSAELAAARLSPADSGLATRLTYGVLSAQGVLDEVIARHARGSLEPQVRDVLRLAAFELLFARVPAYAVLDQAVTAVRARRAQASGLANAVLRRISEEAASFPWGDPLTDRDALARSTGHPRWIVDLALDDLGEEAGRQMLSCGMEPSPVYVRLDPFAAEREATLAALAHAEPVPSPPDPDCYLLETPHAAFREGSRAGWFPMDAAAQMAPRACAPLPGMRVLDVGAGRGNKTVCLQSIAVRAGGPASIVALDLHASKAERLRQRLDESGVPGVETVAADATMLADRFEGTPFDVVLVDAPCTGLGTLRRYPEKRWRLSPEDPARMAELQRALLESAARAVRTGGRVVYSTCSVARAENDAVVEAFLAGEQGRSFEIAPLGELLPAEWQTFATRTGCFGSWPTSGGPDGHYVAVLRRHDA